MSSNVASKLDELLRRGTRDEQLAAICAFGRELLGKDDVDGALVVTDRAVRLDGRSPLAWSLRGEVLARKNRAGEALGCFDRALEQDAACVTALVGKADLLLKIGSGSEALELYEKASKNNPEVGHIWLNRARALESAGHHEEALASLDHALRLNDSVTTWLLHGNILVKAGKHDEARSSFERALAIDEASLDAWYALANAAAKAKDTDGARRAANRFLELAPSDVRAATLRSLLFQLERHAQPRRVPSPRISTPRMRRVSRSLKAVGAPPSQPDLDATDPPPPPESGAVIEIEPSSSDGDSGYEDTLADLISADSLHRAGRHVEALRKIEALVKSAPKETNGWILRARILLVLGKPELAVTSAEQALALDDHALAAWKLLARAFADTKKHDRALDAVVRAEKLSANDAELYRVRGDCLVAANRHTEAVYAFEKAVHYAPTEAENWLALGRVLRLLRRAGAAKEALEKACTLAETSAHPEVATEARGLLARLG